MLQILQDKREGLSVKKGQQHPERERERAKREIPHTGINPILCRQKLTN